MNIHKNDTAVVFIDPQNEVLSEKGLAWGAVGESVRENKTVENMERIFKAARGQHQSHHRGKVEWMGFDLRAWPRG